MKRTYYYLCLLSEKQNVLESNIRVFESLEKVSLSKVEGGKTILSDVLRIQLKLEELRTLLNVLDEQRSEFKAQLAAITNSDFEKEIRVDEKIGLSESPSFNRMEYLQKIQSLHPLIKKLDWQIEANNEMLLLNEKKRRPSIGLGLDYSIIEERTDANPMNNGRDVIIPKIMISFPFDGKRFKAKKEEEELKIQAIKFKKKQTENMLISKIESYKANYESAVLMHNLAKKQISISQSAFEILLSEYSGKGIRFDELMKLQNDVFKYELELIKANIQSHIAKINIERLTDF